MARTLAFVAAVGMIGGLNAAAAAEGYQPRFHIISATLHSDHCPKRRYSAKQEFEDFCENQAVCDLNKKNEISYWFQYSAGRDFCGGEPKFIEIRYYCGEPPNEKRFGPGLNLPIEAPVHIECPPAERK